MMHIATKVANKSPFLRHRLGAVIVKGSRVLSTGYNEIRYTKEFRNPTVHAEQAAILKLLKQQRFNDLNGADIYVTRISPGGNSVLSKPCDMCMGLIQAVGIKNVYYTNTKGISERIRV